MTTSLWVDGQPASESALSSLAFASYATFTSMRIERRGVRGLELHLARLRADAQALFGKYLDDDTVLRALAVALVDVARPCIVRVTVAPQRLDMMNLRDVGPLTIIVSRRSAPDLPMEPIRVTLVDDARARPLVKHGGLFAQMATRRDAQLAGFDDALYAPGGNVSEGTTWNALFRSTDAWVFPNGPSLPGITERLIRSGLVAAGERIEDRAIGRDELSSMVAAYACNATTGAREISAIDNRAFSTDGTLVARLLAAYDTAPLTPLA